MKMLHKIIVGIVLFCSVVSTAQQYKFGKVSKEELSETSYPLDKTANATVLYESIKKMMVLDILILI